MENKLFLGVQQSIYLEGGPLLWILPLYLHVDKKYDDDDVPKFGHITKCNVLKYWNS